MSRTPILILRNVLRILSVGLMVLGTGMVSGQNYPNKPIRIVVPPPGGVGDFLARLIAQGISGPLGQPVIIDNRPGTISGEIVAKAAPDGYNLLLSGNTLWIAPLTRDSNPYDPVRDFSPITLAVSSPNILVLHPSLPVNSVKELIALAKARPGELNYGSGATGGSPHLAAELFNIMARVKIVRIPYKGGGALLNAVIGGQVQLMFAIAGTVTPYLKFDKLRALAVTSSQPSALAPGLPTVAASGLTGFETSEIIAIFAPAKTPAALIDHLNNEIVGVLKRADVKEKVFNAGSEVIGSSPGQLAVAMKSEIDRMGKVIKQAGIKAD